MRPEQIEDLKNIAAEIKSIDHCYGSGLLIPLANKVNASRASMTYQQIPQAKNLDNPEIPRMATGYEKVYGDRSTSYYKSDKDYLIIRKIRKFEDSDMVYALILREVGTDYYHIVFRNEIESFAESSGVRINNSVIDSKDIGDTIKDGEIIYRSNSYDDNMNYRYGINAKTLYMVDPIIVEDAIKISKTMQKRLSTTSVITYNIPKNNNDVFLNMYGGNKHYKIFPDIGEKTKDGILCIRRRIDYNNAQYLLKNRNLRKEMFGDLTYYAEGTIVDIDIYSNTPLSEIPDDNSNSQLRKYLGQINKYWKDIHDTLEAVIDNKSNTYSDDIGVWFARARDILSIGKRIKWNNELSMFDNMIINITVAKSSVAVLGTKLVGRHGNKGVISAIVDDEFMPTDEDGVHSEIVYDALGIIGRLNQSQLYEHEENWMVEGILSEDATPEQKFKSLMDFLEIVNSDQKDLIENFYEKLPKSEKDKFLEELTTDFVIFQPASKALSFKNYAILIDKFKPKKKRFTIKDEKTGEVYNIKRKLIMAPSYVMRLKHEPITKFSVRSKGTINPRTFLPIKSHAYSRGTSLFNNQAVRLGNMEMDLLYLCNDPAAINFMLRLYCTSVAGRREFSTLMNTNIFETELIIDMPNYRSRVVDMFNVTLLPCGLGLEIEFGDTEEIKNKVMKDIRHMSKKQLKIVFKDEYLHRTID